MRKMMFFLVTLVVSTFVFSAWAQQELKLEDVVNKSTYKDNWFLSLGGNVNLLNAEQDAAYDLGSRFNFGGAFTAGKWLSANFGMRLQVNAGVLRGFNYINPRTPNYYTSKGFHFVDAYPKGIYKYPENQGSQQPDPYRLALFQKRTNTPDPSHPNYDPDYHPNFKFVSSKEAKRSGQVHDGFLQEFNYGTATIDLMYNLTNLARGYVKEGGNKFDVIPFAGLGLIGAFDNKYSNPVFYQFVVKVGARLNYNVTPDIGIYLEAQGNATDPEFDGYKGTAILDGVSNLGLGVQYTFNKSYQNIEKLTLDEINNLNQRVNENRNLLENHQDILERQQDLLDRLQNCCDEKQVAVTTPPPAKGWTPGYVLFNLDSYVIQQPEHYKIDDAVEYLKATPESKILLIGYADKKTATPPYNLKLSQKRVEAVAAEFKRLGIDQNRIIIEWRGDKEQPFTQNDWNRVVIMVERK